MKSKIYFVVLLTGVSSYSFSQRIDQSVISAGGDISKSSNMILEWTLGEMAVETVTGTTRMYTQGFHQPLIITKLKPATQPLVGYTVTVFPNPVPAILNVRIQSVVDSRVNLKLHDVRGHIVYTGSTYSKGSSIQINMLAFSAGVYFLTVTNSSGITIGTYKIVKAS